jgi:hypothetical protein
MHWGSVLTDGGAVTGDAVHVAARVARAADRGAVCLTRQVFQELEPAQRLLCHAMGLRELKGLAQAVELLQLDWRDPAAFPRSVLIEETGECLELPQQDIVTFGRLQEHDGSRANDIVLAHPVPDRAREISRWHFELRRVADGLRLRALSDGATTVDGHRVAKGVDVPVACGARICVAEALSLKLVGMPNSGPDPDSGTTKIRRTDA